MVEGLNSVMHIGFSKQLRRAEPVANQFLTGSQRVGGNPVLAFQKFEVSSTCRILSFYCLYLEKVNAGF